MTNPTADDRDLFGNVIEPERPTVDLEPETRGQQIALLEWIGWEQETFRR